MFVAIAATVAPAPAAALARGSVLTEARATPLYRKYVALDPGAQLDPDQLYEAMKPGIRAGTAEVEVYVLAACARLARSDIESFVWLLKKANRYRSYKFQKAPLFRYRPFLNRLANAIRDRDELLRRARVPSERAHSASGFLRFQYGVLMTPYDPLLAAGYFRDAVKTRPRYLEALLHLAEIYERIMDWPRALEVWGRIRTLCPRDFRPYYKIGYIETRTGNFEGALEAWNLGRARRKELDQHREFADAIDSILERVPDLRKDRMLTVDKIDLLERAAADDPVNTETLLALATAYLDELFDVRRAEAAAIRALHTDSTAPEPHLLLAKIYKAMGEVDRAQSEMLEAFARAGGGSEGSRLRAGYRADLWDLVEAKLIRSVLTDVALLPELVGYFALEYHVGDTEDAM